jgi:hypothetical protein
MSVLITAKNIFSRRVGYSEKSWSNPSFTITTLAEYAMSKVPEKGWC